MAAQEFLASFAVEIDEAGVSKLQKILEENAALADSIASAFSSAASAIESFFSDSDFSSLLDMDGGLEITVDLSGAEQDLQAFRQEAEVPIEIDVDVTAISTEGEAALTDLCTEAAKPVEIAADASEIDTEGKKALSAVKTEAAKPIPIAADASKISSEGSKALAAVKNEAAKPIPIAADASDITTKASAALSAVKSAATTPIPLYGDASNLQSAGTNAINQIKLAARTPIVFSANFSGVLQSARTTFQQIKQIFAQKITVTVETTTTNNKGSDGGATNRSTGNYTVTEGKVNMGASSAGNDQITVEQMRAEDAGNANEVAASPAPVNDTPVATSLTMMLNSEDTGSSTIQSTIQESSVSFEDNTVPTMAPPTDPYAEARAQMSEGGRFTTPTDVTVSEDGSTEYIIPVEREDRALPLMRQLLSELSPAAREGLTGEMEQMKGGSSFLSTFVTTAISALTEIIPVSNTVRNVSAPVNINVTATGGNATDIGRTIYNTAERYLLRTLEA